jgi:tetratricopeptide (TPR) repeat protein
MDPRGYEFLWKSRFMRGDWALAVTAIERAIALDSASEPAGRQGCRLCSDLSSLANTYFWWDSLPAAERTAQRIMRLRPQSHGPWDILIRSTAARGDTTAQRVYIRRFRESNPTTITPDYFARRDILLEEYDRAEPIIQSYLESPKPDELANGVWLQTIVFRNQGRLTEALKLANSHPAPADMNLAVASLDAGDARTALSKLRTRASDALSAMSPSLQARNRAWNYTLLGMAEVVARDTAAVRRLADSVEYWGGRSLYGRDRRAHHYLRGMLSVAEGRDNDAAVHLKEAIHSPTNGFTRVNYELGKVLLRLNRPAEAIPIVRAALHGDIDGSNLYVTRTELHELLGQAFDRVGNRDSAAVHYRAVAKAWVHADARFQARHEAIRAWLAANSGLAKPRS